MRAEGTRLTHERGAGSCAHIWGYNYPLSPPLPHACPARAAAAACARLQSHIRVHEWESATPRDCTALCLGCEAYSTARARCCPCVKLCARTQNVAHERRRSNTSRPPADHPAHFPSPLRHHDAKTDGEGGLPLPQVLRTAKLPVAARVAGAACASPLHALAHSHLPERFHPLQLAAKRSKLDDYVMGAEIGRGSFAKVFRVTRKRDNIVYAMKRVRLAGMKQREVADTLSEVRFLASVKHPNLIRYFDSFYHEVRVLRGAVPAHGAACATLRCCHTTGACTCMCVRAAHRGTVYCHGNGGWGRPVQARGTVCANAHTAARE